MSAMTLERRPMDRSLKRKVVAGTVAALAVGGTGAGIAATQLRSSPSEESKAVVSDAAKQLGVQPDQLSSALKKALENQVDAAVAAGRITKAQGDALKQRIESNDFPLFGPMPLGFGFEHFEPREDPRPGREGQGQVGRQARRRDEGRPEA